MTRVILRHFFWVGQAADRVQPSPFHTPNSSTDALAKVITEIRQHHNSHLVITTIDVANVTLSEHVNLCEDTCPANHPRTHIFCVIRMHANAQYSGYLPNISRVLCDRHRVILGLLGFLMTAK